MLARIRKAIEEKEEGFTLIELLVVIIIIGILAAIAIPVFLNQRNKATAAGMKSDLRSVANEMESYFTDYQAYPTANVTGGAGGPVVVGTGGAQVKVSDPATTITAADSPTNAANGYCLKAVNSRINVTWWYLNDGGGLSKTAQGCTA
jgi:type IV pilus assembly protein PilA